MRHQLDRLGTVGLIVVMGIWGCIVLGLGGPFIGTASNGLLLGVSGSGLAGLNCPLSLSNSETKATVANPRRRTQIYQVTMAQPPIGSGGSVELCRHVVVVQSDREGVVSCQVSLDEIRRYDVEEAWYISVIATSPPLDFIDYSEATGVFVGDCIIRSASNFWGALAYGGGVTALMMILWGAFLWPRSKWVDRILTVLLSIAVYGLAWLMNSTVWVGLSYLHLFFSIIAGMLLVMIVILWLAS